MMIMLRHTILIASLLQWTLFGVVVEGFTSTSLQPGSHNVLVTTPSSTSSSWRLNGRLNHYHTTTTTSPTAISLFPQKNHPPTRNTNSNYSKMTTMRQRRRNTINTQLNASISPLPLLRKLSIPNPIPIVAAIGAGALSSLNGSLLLLLAKCSTGLNDLQTMLSILNPYTLLATIRSGALASFRAALTLPTSSKKIIFKQAIQIATIVWIASSLYDTVQTRKRQAVDATSEWGRYSDYPAVRGRVLFALILRMAPYAIVARMINYLPGGDYDLVRRFKERGDSSSKEGGSTNIKDDNVAPTKRSKQSSNLRLHTGTQFANGLLRLGPLYIKIGQILSCRKELLPSEWTTPMEKLQDRVPAKSGREALDLAVESFGGDEAKFQATFTDFGDVPIAAASLGQVHLAWLRKEPDVMVALKVQRSRLKDIYDKDLALMNTIAKAVDVFSEFAGTVGEVGGVKTSWQGIFKDAETILYREINYKAEADNAIRFANDFGIGLGGTAIECTSESLDGKRLPSAAGWMRTPYVYEELSTEKILVMEYVPSIKISNADELRDAGVSASDKEELAENLARAYLRQFCVNKFFSTDPHPGNLGVEVIKNADGKAPTSRLVFYDFGQACSLKDNQAGGVLDVIEGIVDLNVDSCVSAFDRMGVLVEGSDLNKIKSKVQKNFETGKLKVKKRKMKLKNRDQLRDEVASTSMVTSSASNQNDINSVALPPSSVPGDLSATVAQTSGEEIDDKEIMSYFTLPAEYTFVARALSQMDGVGKDLDPDFDFISAAAPHLVEIKGGEKYVEDEVQKFMSKVEGRVDEVRATLFENSDLFRSFSRFYLGSRE